MVNHWNPGTYLGYPCLNLSNQYLMLRQDAPDIIHIPFRPVVDPHGILEDMARSNYIHREENIVEYFTCHIEEGRMRR
jgi:hypothetical protein